VVTDWTRCPEPSCTMPAVIGYRTVLDSTDGPVEHARTNCVNGHWFMLPTEYLAR